MKRGMGRASGGTARHGTPSSTLVKRRVGPICLVLLTAAVSTGPSFNCSVLDEPPAEISKYEPVDLDEVENIKLDADETGHIAVGEGAAWSFDGPNVVRLDLRSGEITDSLLRGGGEIAAGLKAVWVASGPTLVKIDPRGVEVTAARKVLEAESLDLAVSPRGLWVAVKNGRTVARVSPNTLRRLARVRLLRAVERGTGQRTRGEGGLSLASTRDALWVADSQRVSLVRLEPRRLRVLGETRLPATPLDAATGGGAVWVATDDRRVVEVDARTGRIRASYPMNIAISHLAVSRGAVYATGYDDDRLVRLQTASGELTSTTMEGPSGLAVGGGGVWVTRE